MNKPRDLKFLVERIDQSRRTFIKSSAAGAGALAINGLLDIGTTGEAQAFPYEPYPRDDDLETVVTSCAHNCGSRHALVAHKKGDVIVRFNEVDIDHPAKLSLSVADAPMGSTADVVVFRDGDEEQLTVVLGERDPELD